MEWISFFGPRRPIDGQTIYYYGHHFGVRRGTYHSNSNESYWSRHMIHSLECAGYCDRMDAPWWMPDEGQTKPEKPARIIPEDYPHG